EKYLKAALVGRGRVAQKIHDLTALLGDCAHDYPLLSPMSRDVDLLSQYAVLFRYPGQTATREMAKKAVAAMRRCRDEIRAALGFKADAIKRRRTFP
ncbi:MAG: HEPN domain-containing protein, partial [Lentisphaerae bacterium]|nr:HEPN domain-containing protein [Lentisphaerota bacterium]